ncbi:ISL3 family transposase [Chamaesiphon minutus]|uniref:ISL3 family transposase n=1 Tax=Chamaesiphon minutus TaxID=1173032 RepID=UPI0018DEEED0|nr:ISL3 family transposase [Chamaesiphon minutus]
MLQENWQKADARSSGSPTVKRTKQDWGDARRISLDEFSRRKGKGQFATVVTNLDNSSLLEVVDSHKSDDIIEVLKRQPEQMHASVEEVCVDMWGGFPKVIKEVFINAEIVIDRFHVMKLVNKSLNKIRLKLGLTGLKNKSLLTTNNRDLNDVERVELSELFQQSTVLEIAYEFKEELRHIYESNSTVKSGLAKMRRWLKYAGLFFADIANTLESHLPEIANFFANRTTSAVTEGINTKIKLILRQSYGFATFELMREKLLACSMRMNSAPLRPFE